MQRWWLFKVEEHWHFRLYRARQLEKFQGQKYPKGHRPTNYRAWTRKSTFYAITFREARLHQLADELRRNATAHLG